MAPRVLVPLAAIVLLAALSTAPSARMQQPSPPRPPNIVYIIADDLGSADLGVYGSRHIRTPNLDRLAAQGIRFTQAYAGSTVCAPSRSTIMTGKHMGHTPVRSNTGGVSLRTSDVTVAEVLKRAGYATGGYGKWGLAEVGQPGVPERKGFDEFFGYYHQIHAHEFYPAFLYRNSERVDLPGNRGFYDGPLGEGRGVGPIPPVEGATGSRRQFSQHLIVERMKSFIRENRDRPFFAYGAWTAPHSRFELPEDEPAWQLYKDQPWPMNVRVYAAFVSMVDRQVGEVLTLLDELGVANNTVVLFSSDNGGLTAFNTEPLRSNAPYRGGKTTLFEGGLRVPFVVRWPGHIEPGRVSAHVTYFPDLFPTLAQIAGAGESVPSDIDGISILPELIGARAAGAEQRSHEYLYWEDADIDWNAIRYRTETLRQAVRSGDWKAYRSGPGRPLQLFNLKDDIGESRDVAASHPDVVARMERHMTNAHVPPPPQIEPERLNGRSYR